MNVCGEHKEGVTCKGPSKSRVVLVP
jgi:hypothetical protein